jgi:hypothetical protein
MADRPIKIDIPENGHDEPPDSGQTTPEALAVRRPRKVYAGMWGVPEIVAVAVGAVVLLGVVLLYVLVVLPSNRELAKNRSEADRLEAERLSARTKYGEINDTEKQVAKLLASADDFETRFLPPASNGRGEIYQRINGLITGFGLTNTTGPDYAPLEPAEQKVANQTDVERGREKFRSLFPGVYVTMTVEGSYQNLRRFLREIETGNEFVIVSSIELAPSDTEQKKPETGVPQQQPGQPQPVGIPLDGKSISGDMANVKTGAVKPQNGPARPVGKTHGEVVALRLEMAAYFRRANYSPLSVPVAGK